VGAINYMAGVFVQDNRRDESALGDVCFQRLVLVGSERVEEVLAEQPFDPRGRTFVCDGRLQHRGDCGAGPAKTRATVADQPAARRVR
jgi:hypothetical protein